MNPFRFYLKLGFEHRAFILNYRPKKMVELERQKGYDHSGDIKEKK